MPARLRMAPPLLMVAVAEAVALVAARFDSSPCSATALWVWRGCHAPAARAPAAKGSSCCSTARSRRTTVLHSLLPTHYRLHSSHPRLRSSHPRLPHLTLASLPPPRPWSLRARLRRQPLPTSRLPRLGRAVHSAAAPARHPHLRDAGERSLHDLLYPSAPFDILLMRSASWHAGAAAAAPRAVFG